MISYKTNYDAIVVGGGPAGSTTGALLAEKGHDVLVLEKEKFLVTFQKVRFSLALFRSLRNLKS